MKKKSKSTPKPLNASEREKVLRRKNLSKMQLDMLETLRQHAVEDKIALAKEMVEVAQTVLEDVNLRPTIDEFEKLESYAWN